MDGGADGRRPSQGWRDSGAGMRARLAMLTAALAGTAPLAACGGSGGVPSDSLLVRTANQACQKLLPVGLPRPLIRSRATSPPFMTS
jgi:hypothetical protein